MHKIFKVHFRLNTNTYVFKELFIKKSKLILKTTWDKIMNFNIFKIHKINRTTFAI